ncbi:MAG: hypothetical protein IJZ68_05790 [Bacteroidaceae bacterium]|nr:hypothetical protein [Bacteroidaceae bacterium]
MQFRKIKIEHISENDIKPQHVVLKQQAKPQDVVITPQECSKACRALSRRRKKNA